MRDGWGLESRIQSSQDGLGSESRIQSPRAAARRRHPRTQGRRDGEGRRGRRREGRGKDAATVEKRSQATHDRTKPHIIAKAIR